MASYHFKIKTDIKPDGSKVNAADHSDYNDRDGDFKDIDERRERQMHPERTSAEAHTDYLAREGAFTDIDQKRLVARGQSASNALNCSSSQEALTSANSKRIENEDIETVAESSVAQYGGCVHKDHHLPAWANNSSKKFWQAANQYSPASGTAYREIEFALPLELNLNQQKEIVNDFVAKHLGDDFYWSLNIHDKNAAMGNGERNPHVHIQFCERKLDQIERDSERPPEVFFIKANRYHREKGGPNKDPKWDGNERFKYLIEMRKDFAMIQNSTLENYGFDVRVDHRTLVAQRDSALERGDLLLAQMLDRAPEENVGPKHVYQVNDAKVIELQKYREIKKAHQQLLITADEIAKTILKDETNQSVKESAEQANLVVSEITSNNMQEVKELQFLSASIIETSKELAIVKDMFIWDDKAAAEARRSLMTPEELSLESRVKLINEERLTLKRFEKETNTPSTSWYHALAEETPKTKQEITNRLSTLDEESKILSIKLQEINHRFLTEDNQLKIKKAKKEILLENQAAKNAAKELQIKLENLVKQTKETISAHIDQKVQSIEDQINILLAEPRQEQAILEQQRLVLTDRKIAFEAKVAPTFFSEGRTKWLEEKMQLAKQEQILSEQETNIQAKMEAIKKNIYESKPTETAKVEAGNNTTTANQNTEQKAAIESIQFTAKQAHEIIGIQLRSITSELNHIKSELNKIQKKPISPEYFELMAKHKFLGSEYKLALAERDSIKKQEHKDAGAKKQYKTLTQELNLMKKPNWFAKNPDYDALVEKINLLSVDIKEREANLTTRITNNQKQLAILEAKCITPHGKLQIEKIAKEIAKDNADRNKPTPQEQDLIKQKASLEKEVPTLTTQKTTLGNQVKHERNLAIKTNTKEPKYEVAKSSSTGRSGACGGRSSSESSNQSSNGLLDAAKALAEKLANPKIASLVMRIPEGGEGKDLSAMTDEQIETYLAKVNKENLM